MLSSALATGPRSRCDGGEQQRSIKYMEDKIGQVFEATIDGTMNGCFFVETNDKSEIVELNNESNK